MPPLPPNFWNEEYRRLLALLTPKLTEAAQRGARGAGQQLGLGVNYQMSDADAAQWAQTYTDKLLRQLGTTTENLVGAELETYFSTPGATLGDLQTALTPKLAGNTARANAIAVTEVTRAYSAGQRAAYTRNGVKRWKWRTGRDELVCSTCGPLNEQVVEIGQPFGMDKKGNPILEPPAHPNCRCFTAPVVDVPVKPPVDIPTEPTPQPAAIVALPVVVAPPPPPPPVLKPLDHAALKQVDLHAVEPTWNVPPSAKKLRYGGVIFDDQGRVLMRKPTGNFDGYAWTFPKGGGEKNEHPVDVAVREVAQESGHRGKIMGLVPGGYDSGSSRNYFFVMRSDSYNPNRMDKETEEVLWATPAEAKQLIAQTTNAAGRERDLKILDAAVQANADLVAGKVDQSHLFPAPKPPEPVPAPVPPAAVEPAQPAKPKAKPKGFPASVEALTPVRGLGGSTGAQLMRDAQGREFVVKRGASAAHLREESAADSLYQALGVNVPKHSVYETPQGPVKVSEFMPNTKTLKQVLASGDAAEIKRVRQQLQKGFGADALLGNWDVIGLDADNILVDDKGKVWRVDNGGALRFRAQGTKKAEFSAYPTELWTMRGKVDKGNAQAKAIFGDLSYDDVVQQMRELSAKRTAILQSAPDEIRETLRRRLNEMDHLVEASDHMELVRWTGDYRDRFAQSALDLRKRGIVDNMPAKLKASRKRGSQGAFGGFDVEVKDENGKPFDNLRGSGSRMEDLHVAIRESGGDPKLLSDWMAAQAGDSWSAGSRAYKYYIATQGKNNPGDFFWKPSDTGQDGFQYSKDCYERWVRQYGGPEKFKRTMDAYHAFTYELLMRTDMPNIDRKRQVARLVRTESGRAVTGHQPGDKNIPALRGAAESLSLLNPVFIHNQHLTEQDIPFADILGTYLTDRGGGSSHSAFYGDTENEFVCILGRTVFDYIFRR
jgi:SPP1 gp7 family putative phage head morphogenesis protein